ncbi:MAG: acyl-CoA dehydrogenase family protein, partial [Polyangiaceae bacterium]
MEFDLTEEQTLMRDTARDFAAREIAPKASELDKSGRWPAEILAQMGELGLMGVSIPTEYGGSGMDALSYALAMEEISFACASCGVIMSVNNSLFCDPIYKFGTAEQRERVLVPAASGRKLGCFGLTEPMSGSDAQTMATSAERSGSGWVINGAKNWITNGPHADWIIVFAVTERGAKVKHTAFLVERGTPGFTHNPPDHKLGIHAAQSCTVFFENCRVSDADVIGDVGAGFKVAMASLDGGRIGIACQAIGIARAAFERSVAYAKERKSFGVPIAQHQAVQFMLSDMATQIDAARLLAWRAAALKDKGVRHTT